MSDLRTKRTRSSLKKAFLTLLEQYRFEEITVQQLCECAQIRRATFYTHFADKYQFLSFFIEEMRDEFVEHIKEINQDTYDKPDLYFDKLFHELILFFKGHPQLVRNIKNSQMLPTMTEIFVESVQKYVYEYLIENSDTDSTLAEMKSYFYSGGILQLILLWISKPDSFQVDNINWLRFLI